MSDQNKKPAIVFPYRGARASYFVYHPAHHGSHEKEGQWEESARRFMRMLDDFCGVCTMYNEHETLHESVGGPAWKKEVLKIFTDCEKDGKNVYALEALSETIFDVESRVAQRVLPYFSEIQKRGVEIRAEDFGLSLNGGVIPSTHIVKRSWGS